MNNLWRRVKAEWEVAACVLAALAFSATLAIGWLRLHADDEQQGTRKQANRKPSLLAPGAYAFLQDLPEPTGEEAPSPFIFEGLTKLARPPRPRPEPPKPKPKPEPVAPAPMPPPVVTAPEPAAPEPPNTVKRYLYGVREVSYLFSGRGATGKPVATIQLRDPASGQLAPVAIVPIGEMVDGIKVVSFDQAALNVLDARGVRHRIPFGKAARVNSTPTIVEVPR